MELNNLLAGGGIAAVVVAGWQQVKTAFSYVSSFVLVTAKVDSALNRSLVQHLRYDDWKLVPGGPLYYVGTYLGFRDGDVRLVPFRPPANKAIYRRGFQLLFVNTSSDSGTYTFIRGTLNFDAVLVEAMTRYDLRSGPQDLSRFCINKVFGREKGMWASGNQSQDDSISPSRSVGESPALSSGAMPSIYTALDKSFLYDSEDWIFTRKDDPFEYLYFGTEILRYIEQARSWLKMKDWYLERHVPWRRGWLLYGPPGTGKSSIAKATAQSLGIPIYQFNLSTLSDQELVREWGNMQTPCIPLLEDFDAVFRLRENVTDNKSLTFDCVLNVISGISARQGIFLMVTTNHLEHIDPALGIAVEGDTGVSSRPGRIDTVIRVGNMSAENQGRMASRILKDWPELIASSVANHPDVTPSQFEEVCVQLAYKKLAEKENA